MGCSVPGARSCALADKMPGNRTLMFLKSFALKFHNFPGSTFKVKEYTKETSILKFDRKLLTPA